MKWETRDIDVVERANTEKFSKLDNIVTPLRLPELFFDDVLVDMVVGYTKLHSHREKADISFKTADEKIWLFFSMLLLSGCHCFKTIKFIGRRYEIYLDTRSDSVPRNTFEHIFRNLHLCDNEQLDK